MVTRIAIVAALILLSACNLSDSPPGAPTERPLPAQPPTDLPPTENMGPTPLPGVAQPDAPGGLPTRTPIGAPPVGGTVIPTPGPIATSPTGETAIISSPPNGGVVANGVLQVSGVVIGLPRDEFTLVLVAPDGRVLNSQHITLQNPNNVAEVPWSAAMTTGPYTGPAQIRVLGQNAQGAELLLAQVNIALGASASGAAVAPPASSGRSETPQGSITSPASGAVVSGSAIQVTGTVGGIQSNQFLLALVTADGTVINSQLVTLSNDNYTQIVPWAAALGTNDYRGAAEIRALTAGGASQTTFATVQISLQ